MKSGYCKRDITPQTFNEITFKLFTLKEQSEEVPLCNSSLTSVWPSGVR